MRGVFCEMVTLMETSHDGRILVAVVHKQQSRVCEMVTAAESAALLAAFVAGDVAAVQSLIDRPAPRALVMLQTGPDGRTRKVAERMLTLRTAFTAHRITVAPQGSGAVLVYLPFCARRPSGATAVALGGTGWANDAVSTEHRAELDALLNVNAVYWNVHGENTLLPLEHARHSRRRVVNGAVVDLCHVQAAWFAAPPPPPPPPARLLSPSRPQSCRQRTDLGALVIVWSTVFRELQVCTPTNNDDSDDEHRAHGRSDQFYTFTLSRLETAQDGTPRCCYAQAPLFPGTLYACTPNSDGREAVALLHSRESGLHCRLLRPFDMAAKLSTGTTEVVRLLSRGWPAAAAMSKIGDTYVLLHCDADHTNLQCVQLVVLVLRGSKARCMHTFRVIDVTHEVADMVSSPSALNEALPRALPPVAALEFSPCGRYLLVLSRGSARARARARGHTFTDQTTSRCSGGFGAIAVDLGERLLWSAAGMSPHNQVVRPKLLWTLADCVPRAIRWTDSGVWMLQSRRSRDAARTLQNRDSESRTSCTLILRA
jgi:hypothetical protein